MRLEKNSTTLSWSRHQDARLRQRSGTDPHRRYKRINDLANVRRFVSRGTRGFGRPRTVVLNPDGEHALNKNKRVYAPSDGGETKLQVAGGAVVSQGSPTPHNAVVRKQLMSVSLEENRTGPDGGASSKGQDMSDLGGRRLVILLRTAKPSFDGFNRHSLRSLRSLPALNPPHLTHDDDTPVLEQPVTFVGSHGGR